MTTTDVLLVVTIVLLLAATGINMKGDLRQQPYHYPEYLPGSCESSFQRNSSPVYSNRNKENYVASVAWDDTYVENNDVDEIREHTKSRGLVPKSNYQKNNTKNYWKSYFSQPVVDNITRSNDMYSSDLMTPYRNQHKLRKVNPSLRKVKAPVVGSTLFEKVSVYPYD
jgi:hypothetical protein